MNTPYISPKGSGTPGVTIAAWLKAEKLDFRGVSPKEYRQAKSLLPTRPSEPLSRERFAPETSGA